MNEINTNDNTVIARNVQRPMPTHNDQSTGHGGHTSSDRQAQGQGAHRSGMDEYVQREMERDTFMHSHNGKYKGSNNFVNKVFYKPYMFANRDSALTLRQKAEARPGLSAIEYVDATLTLLSDNHAYDPLDYEHIMSHLRKVTRDAIDRPWLVVRRWSQYIWDAVESGAIGWDDKEAIQEECTCSHPIKDCE